MTVINEAYRDGPHRRMSSLASYLKLPYTIFPAFFQSFIRIAFYVTLVVELCFIRVPYLPSISGFSSTDRSPGDEEETIVRRPGCEETRNTTNTTILCGSLMPDIKVF